MAAQANKDSQRKAHFTFIWIIENASAFLVSWPVESPSFIVKSIEKTKWYWKVIFNSKQVIFYIRRMHDNGPHSIEIEYEISILKDDGSSLEMPTNIKKFQCGDMSSYCTINNCKEFLRRDALFSSNDTLSVRCRMWRTGTEISKADTCFARTRLGVDRRCFIWPVREFSSLRSKQKRTHFVNPPSSGRPQLILSVFVSETNCKNYVNIETCLNSGIGMYCVFCKYSLLDSEGKVVHSIEDVLYFDVDSNKKRTFQNFFGKDNLMADKDSLLQNDVLYLKCELHISAKPVLNRIEFYGNSSLEDLASIPNEMFEMQHGEPEGSCTVSHSLKKAFEDLYEDDSLSDVSLRTGATSFPAHKNILSVRSPVFKAMFTQDMRERSSKVVDIPDFDSDTLKRLLIYIYKDTVDELRWQSAMDLFRAADKYQLLDLRKKCSLFLKSNLSVENVCSILSLADMHEEEYLRKAAEYFVSRHDTEVFKSDAWKNFKKENHMLAVEMMERIINLIHHKYESS